MRRARWRWPACSKDVQAPHNGAGSQPTGHVLVVDTSQQFLPPRGISIYSTEQACMDGTQQRIDFLASKGVHKASKTKDESEDKNVARLTYPDGTWTRFTCSFADGKLLSGNAPAN